MPFCICIFDSLQLVNNRFFCRFKHASSRVAKCSSIASLEIVLHNMASEFRKDPEDAAVNSGHFMEGAVTPPVQIDSDCGGNSVLRVKRSLRRRDGVDYCLFEYSSEDGLDNAKRVKVYVCTLCYL